MREPEGRTGTGNEPGPIAWVLDETDLEFMLEAMATCTKVVVDLETTGLREHAIEGGVQNGGVGARIALAALTLPQKNAFGSWDGREPTSWVVPLSHPDSPFLGCWRKVVQSIFQQCADLRLPLSNQNLKFDLKYQEAFTGLDLSHLVVWDTVVGSKLLDETRSAKLKERVPEEFGIPPWNEFDLSTPGAAERVDMWDLGYYGAQDTYWTFRWEEEQRFRMFLGDVEEPPSDRDEVNDARSGKLATWVAMPTVASLTRIEQNGFLLDEEWTRAKLADDERITREALDELSERYSMDRSKASLAPTSYWFLEVANRAVEAGDLAVIAMTKNGRPSWGKGVLRKEVAMGLRGAEIIQRGRQSSKRSEYLRSWLHHMDPITKRIHATYNAGGAATGRLSARDPNMQQVTKSLRPAFIPDPGFVIADLDYSQLELRVAAFLSQSPTMMEAYKEGQDLHRLIAANTVNQRRKKEGLHLIGPEDVSPEDRQAGKAANFGLLYGQTAYGFMMYAEDSYEVFLTEQEAVDFYNSFFETWTGLREWHQQVISAVHRDGYIVSPLGRIRRLPGVWDGNPKRVKHAENAALNSPVQGFGSDLMQMAAASIQGLLHGTTAVPNTTLLGTVHDSLIGQVPEDDWETPVRAMQERMINLDEVLRKMDVEFNVPLAADASIGTRWSLSDVGSL